jgi:DNA (cytosine-5)-methyltransferase 1
VSLQREGGASHAGVSKRRAVVSLFSGGGGLDLGLETAGFETRVAVDSDKWACWTLRTNKALKNVLPSGRSFLAKAEVIERDIRAVSGQELLRRLSIEPGELGLVCGGPPCVSFSVAGGREGLTSETGLLFEAYARLLRVLRPRAFVFENVKGLLTAAGRDGKDGGAWPEILKRLGDAGYRISWQVLDAAAYGVGQHRERLIVVGLRGKRGKPFEFPAPSHGEPEGPPFVDVARALAGLPAAAQAGSDPALANHVARRHTPELVASFEATARGSRNDRYKRDRLRWDRPAKVVRAQGKLKSAKGGARHSSSQAIHPDEPRQLTARECARIQSFPDWFVFPPTHCNGYRVVGDAVPPLLGEAIGRTLIHQAFPDETPHGRSPRRASAGGSPGRRRDHAVGAAPRRAGSRG